MSSILLSRIPERVARDDVIQLLRHHSRHDDIDYVLFPLGKDHNRALVSLKSSRAAEELVKKSLDLHGHRLKLRPAPRQTYQRITAEVDPLIVASVPDLDLISSRLKDEFGVRVTYSGDVDVTSSGGMGGTLMLTGSMLQIQCAQTHLDHVFAEQQEAEKEALMLLEQDLATPRSQMSMCSDTPAQFEDQLMEKLRAQGGAFGDTGPISASQQVINHSKPRSGSALVQGVMEERHSAPIRAQSAMDTHAQAPPPGARSMPASGAGGAADMDPLMRSAPVQAWGERSGAVTPPDRPGVTLELDQLVMSFIRKIHKHEVQAMERKHDAMFFFKSSKDVMKTRLVSNLTEDEGAYTSLDKLKEEFVAFYQTIFYSVVKESLAYDENEISQSEIEAVVVAVSKAFASRVYINDKKRGKITLVGSWEYVSLVLDWIKQKLGLAPATSEKPMEGTWAGPRRDVDDVSDVKKSMADTWSGGPIKSKSGPKAHKENTAAKIKRSSQSITHSANQSTSQPFDQSRSRSALGSSFGRTSASITDGPHSDVADMIVRGRPAPRTSVDPSNGSLRSSLSRSQSRDQQVLHEQTIGGVHVTVMAADITTVKADVMVNASNETLHHLGNVAASINAAAGRGFQEECSRYVTKHGPLKVSEVMSTRGQGRLPCQHVVHAVGPMWCLYDDKTRCANALRRTFTNALYYANNKLKATSLVMPAIGTGIYGVPLDVCARAMHEAIESFSRAASSLKHVTVCDLEEEGAGMIAIIFQQLSQLRNSEDAASEAGSEADSVTQVKQMLQAVELEQTLEDSLRPPGSGDPVGGKTRILDASDSAERFASEEVQVHDLESEGFEARADTPGEEEGPVSPPPSPSEDHPRSLVQQHANQIDRPANHEEGPASPPPSPADDVMPQAPVVRADAVSEIFAAAPGSNLDIQSPRSQGQQTARSQQMTPRSGQQTPRSKQITPRSGQQTPRSHEMTPRSGQQTPRSQIMSPRSGQQTPRSQQRSGQVTPKSDRSARSQPSAGILTPQKRSEHTPRSDSPEAVTPRGESPLLGDGEITPRSVTSDHGIQAPVIRADVVSDMFSAAPPTKQEELIGSGTVTPKSGAITPGSDMQSLGLRTPRSETDNFEQGLQTPKSGQFTPRSGLATPKSGRITPKSGQVTPRSQGLTPVPLSPQSGAQTPVSGKVTPRSGQQTPKSGILTPQSVSRTPRSGVLTPRSDDVTPTGTPRDYSPEGAAAGQGQNVIVAVTSHEVQSSAPPPQDIDSAQSPDISDVPRDSIPELESQLLDQAFSQRQSISRTPVGRPRISIDSVYDTVSSPVDVREIHKQPLLIRLLSHCVCIAAKAGDIIRAVSQQSELGIVEKEAQDLQTEADRCAQSCIIGSLGRLFPGLKLIGEEGDDVTEFDPKWLETSQSVDVLQFVRVVPDDFRNLEVDDFTVWVDPLDGTSDFVNKNVEVCTVLIGIAVKGRAVAGVIHQPFFAPETPTHELGRTVWGLQGIGVFGLDLEAAPRDQMVIVTSRRPDDVINETVQACEPTDVQRIGGSGFKALKLLEGAAHALVYPLYGFMKWDTCAPEALLTACGGQLTDIHGNSYVYTCAAEPENRGGVLAAVTAELHHSLVSKIPASILDQVPTDGPAPWQQQTRADDAHAPLVTQLVAASFNIALKSGDIIRAIMSQGDLGIVEKGVNDLQTQADRSVEQCIMASLQAQFPDVRVIGEEGQALEASIDPDWIVTSQAAEVLSQAAKLPEELQDVRAEEVTVWVDPLDGTAEYTQGLLDHVTVLIGIAVRGRAMAGVIYQPYYNYQAGPDAKLGRVIWGVIGIGAYGFERHTPPEGENIITTTRSHSNQTVLAAVDACEPTEVLRVGGAGHKVLLIIEGQAHAYVFGSPGCKKWDTCAPEAVLHAIGGKLTDTHGNYYQYHPQVQVKNTGGVIATTTVQSHTYYSSKMPEEVLQALPSDGPAPWQLAQQVSEKLDSVSKPLVTRLVASSVNIALKSGDIIRAIMSQGDLGIVEKGVNDLQTQADRSVEQCIMASLQAQFPDVRVIGEEGQALEASVDPDWIVTSQSSEVLSQASDLPEELQDVRAEEVTVWVDPLDGTAEYTQGLLDHVTVLIGIAVRGRAMAGVIYQPYYNYQAGPDAKLGRVIWGVIGLGAYGFERNTPPEGENIITTTRSHSNQTVLAAVEACEPTEVLRVGGAGHKVLLIIEGQAHAYVFGSPGCKKWDTCAPEAVLHAIGGKLTDTHGNYYQYHPQVQVRNTGGVIATTTVQSHTYYSSKMPEEVLQALPSDGPAPWQLAQQVSEKLDPVSKPLVTRLVAASVNIAFKSGDIIRAIMSQGDLGIVEKGVNDLQTQADRSVEQCIMASLQAQFPDVRVIGEEGQALEASIDPDWIVTSQSSEVLSQASALPEDLQDVRAEEVTVWVDPLDGTAEYTQGLLDHVTVLIGIAVKGRAMAGVIYQPYFNYQAGPDAKLGRVIWGVIGLGAYGFDRNTPPEGENIITTTRSHSNQTVLAAVDACEPTEVLRVGGAGHKVLLIIEGQAHAYVFGSPGCKKWDTCAPEAVLHAIGGKLTDTHGNYYQYHPQVQVRNTGGVIATTTTQSHTYYSSKMPEEVLQALPSDGPAPWQLAQQVSEKLDSVSKPLVTRLVAASVNIALKSGDIIRAIMSQGDLGIVEKGVNDLQTQADRSVEQCIMASLQAQFPDVRVIGEEGQALEASIDPDWIVTSQAAEVLSQASDLPEDLQDVRAEEVTVWVDPLDGTAEYTQGLLDHVTVLIGIAVKGRAMAGVIYQPYYNYEAGPDAELGRVIWGVIGLGAYGFERNTPPEGENIITTTRSHSNQTVLAAVDACEPTEVLRVGGAGHKVLLIIEGKAHAYVFGSPGCKKWDTCAPEAVLHAIGGKLTDTHGNYYQYHPQVQVRNTGGVLATTTEQSHEHYSSKMPQEVLQALPTDGPAPWQTEATPHTSSDPAAVQSASKPLILRLVAASVDIAQKAGRVIRQISGGEDLGVVDKGVNDFQTQADRSAQKCILSSLAKQFPELKVIAEETLDEHETLDADWLVESQSDDVLSLEEELPANLIDVSMDDVIVWVDPLDGTKAFTEGQLNSVTVLIGIAVKDEPVAGIIYEPFYRETEKSEPQQNHISETEGESRLGRALWGIVGVGAFGFDPSSPADDTNVIATASSNSNVLNRMAVNACEPTSILTTAGVGRKAVLLLEGRAHAFIKATSSTYPWDTCAPDALLRASGGKMTDICGRLYQYGGQRGAQKQTTGVLATGSAQSHERYLRMIPQEVMDHHNT